RGPRRAASALGRRVRRARRAVVERDGGLAACRAQVVSHDVELSTQDGVGTPLHALALAPAARLLLGLAEATVEPAHLVLGRLHALAQRLVLLGVGARRRRRLRPARQLPAQARDLLAGAPAVALDPVAAPAQA